MRTGAITSTGGLWSGTSTVQDRAKELHETMQLRYTQSMELPLWRGASTRSGFLSPSCSPNAAAANSLLGGDNNNDPCSSSRPEGRVSTAIGSLLFDEHFGRNSVALMEHSLFASMMERFYGKNPFVVRRLAQELAAAAERTITAVSAGQPRTPGRMAALRPAPPPQPVGAAAATPPGGHSARPVRLRGVRVKNDVEQLMDARPQSADDEPQAAEPTNRPSTPLDGEIDWRGTAGRRYYFESSSPFFHADKKGGCGGSAAAAAAAAEATSEGDGFQEGVVVDCSMDAARAALIRLAEGDDHFLELALQSQPSGDSVHRLLRDTEVSLKLLQRVHQQNLVLCADHERWVRRCIVDEYEIQSPLLAFLGQALGSLVALWAAAERGVRYLRLLLQLVAEEERARLLVEAEAWSCRLLAPGDTAGTPRGSHFLQGDELRAAWRATACECCQLDVAVRHLSGIHLSPSPKLPCYFVRVATGVGRRWLEDTYLEAHNRELTAALTHIWVFEAEASDRARLAELAIEERLRIQQYGEYVTSFIVVRRPPSESSTVTCVPDGGGGATTLLLRPCKPVTFKLFCRLQHLQDLEEARRTVLWAVDRCDTQQAALQSIEELKREVVERRELEGRVDALLGLEQDTRASTILAVEATAFSDLLSCEATGRENTQEAMESTARMALRESCLAFLPYLETWERLRRNQLSLWEQRCFLQVATLRRDVIRQQTLEDQTSATLASDGNDAAADGHEADSRAETVAVASRGMLVRKQSMLMAAQIDAQLASIAFQRDGQTLVHGEGVLRERICAEMVAALEGVRNCMNLFRDYAEAYLFEMQKYEFWLQRLSVEAAAHRAVVALRQVEEEAARLYALTLPEPLHCYDRAPLRNPSLMSFSNSILTQLLDFTSVGGSASSLSPSSAQSGATWRSDDVLRIWGALLLGQ